MFEFSSKKEKFMKIRQVREYSKTFQKIKNAVNASAIFRCVPKGYATSITNMAARD